jgi:ferritin-like metal-binding protein YciE
MDEDLEDFGKTKAADDVLIGCAQAMEHYEISRYGLLKTWARKLGLTDAEGLLGQTLKEEKKADALLTKVAGQDQSTTPSAGTPSKSATTGAKAKAA